MGFGLLFVGYLLLFVCKGADIFPDIAAYAFIFAAIYKLAAYNKGFKYAKYVMYPLMLFAAANDTFQIMGALKLAVTENSAFQACGSAVSAVNSVVLVVFYYYMFSGIRMLAEQVDVPKIASHAKRNWYITIVYTVLSLVISLGIPAVDSMAKYFGLAFVLFGLVWVALNAVLIFNCYMYICLEGDEDMPIKTRRKKKEDGENK